MHKLNKYSLKKFANTVFKLQTSNAFCCRKVNKWKTQFKENPFPKILVTGDIKSPDEIAIVAGGLSGAVCHSMVELLKDALDFYLHINDIMFLCISIQIL